MFTVPFWCTEVSGAGGVLWGIVVAHPGAAEIGDVATDGARLFDAVGAFLRTNGLSPDPEHYAFAYRIVAAPDGTLAQHVAQLTDGGVRLTGRDIQALGGKTAARPIPRLAVVPTTAPRADHVAEQLVARTQIQVDGFGDMVAAMRMEAQGFGRDLAASAAAIPSVENGAAVLRLTTAMIERVRSTESRLSDAERETSRLREQLAVARGDARRDPLTELPNRRALEEAFAAGADAGGTLCLAICDIDRFKRVNDTHCHAVSQSGKIPRRLQWVGVSAVSAGPPASVPRACHNPSGSQFSVSETPPAGRGRPPDLRRSTADSRRGSCVSAEGSAAARRRDLNAGPRGGTPPSPNQTVTPHREETTMRKSELYLEAALTFAPDAPGEHQQLARQLREWVEHQAQTIREACRTKRLRCLVHITRPLADGELVSCDFLAPSGRYLPILIASSGRNEISGRKPHIAGLGASLQLLALLAKELGVPVTLQP